MPSAWLPCRHTLKDQQKKDPNIWTIEQDQQAEEDEDGKQNKNKKEKLKEKENAEEPNSNAADDSADLTDRFPLKLLFFYKEQGSKMLNESDHAIELGLKRVSMTDIMSLKSQLENIVWDQFAVSMQESKCHEWLMVNINDPQRMLISYICYSLHRLYLCVMCVDV